ncbi:MAG: Vitamin B12 import ATP-binding protein BtuD [Phycisphaerae bacterium]|nr:Vitamin B12 import ATP-binding protein BtuD [Phycisphaerae bacterium]
MGDLRVDIQFRRRLRRSEQPFALQFAHTFSSPVTSVVGPNGCGKTTLLNLLAGLLRPDAGRIHCDGDTWFDASSRRCLPARGRGVGYVFQEGRLFDHMTVRGNLRYGASRPGPQAVAFDELVELLGLGALLERWPAALSGGQRQRVALGRALLSRPRLLLMDEPMASLDRPTAWRLLGELHPLLRRIGVPAIYVTHHLSEAVYLAGDDGELVVMAQGALQAAGRPTQMLDRPGMGHLTTEEPLENVWTLAVTHRDGQAFARLGDANELELELPADVPPDATKVMIALRANDVILATTRPVGLSARNVLPGTIEHVGPLDGHAWVRVNIGVPLLVSVTDGTVRSMGLAEGGQVFAVIKTTSLQIINP